MMRGRRAAVAARRALSSTAGGGGGGGAAAARPPADEAAAPLWQRAARPVMIFEAPGPVEYREAWRWQRELNMHRIRKRDDRDVLLLLEHSPVYTLGRSATEEHLRFPPDRPPPGTELLRVERGGEVTYHCPGQLVGYPILDLNHYKRDLHWYLRKVEGVLLEVLGGYGLSGDRDEDLTGVWLNGAKVAAIGINVSRWVTMHGFSLNVSADLANFGHIVPCGIEDKPVCSLDGALGAPPPMDEVRAAVAREFERAFNVELVRRPWEELESVVALDGTGGEAPLPPQQ